MKNPPSRDKLIIWCAVGTGCAMMALLMRAAAINKFGCDEFTGNVLFVVVLLLAVGFYLMFQSAIESLFTRSRRKPHIAIAETPTGEMVEVDTDDNKMEFSSSETEEDTLVAEPAVEPFDLQVDDDDYWTQAYLESLSEEEREDYHNKIRRVKCKDSYDIEVGEFESTTFVEEHVDEDGWTVIEETEMPIYIAANGSAYFLNDIEKFIQFYQEHGDDAEQLQKLKVEYQMSEKAHKELIESQRQDMLQKIEFVCAYITHYMRPHLDADELCKLHTNASKLVNAEKPPVNPVYVRENSLNKEDLKHLGYSIGKFLNLDGKRIGQFIKNVFHEEFKSTQLSTIVQKLTESKSKDEKIPILSKQQMDDLFFQFKLHGKIDTSVIYKKQR